MSVRFLCMICSRVYCLTLFEVSTVEVSMESFTFNYQCIGFMLYDGPSMFSVIQCLLAYAIGTSSWRIAAPSPILDAST